jgi:hypothetical protein
MENNSLNLAAARSSSSLTDQKLNWRSTRLDKGIYHGTTAILRYMGEGLAISLLSDAGFYFTTPYLPSLSNLTYLAYFLHRTQKL